MGVTVPITLIAHIVLAGCLAITGIHGASAQPAPTSAPQGELPLFAVEITTGNAWVQAKPAHEQLHFREHSANLKRLREAGSLIMGARYSDKGLVVLAARDETHARTMLDEDPSFKAEVFKYQVHPFNVFYAGTVNTRQRRAAP